MILENLKVDYIIKEDKRYLKEIECFNRAIKKYPIIIIKCSSVEDVKQSVIWIKENNLKFRIRSGRHHYEGYSTGDDIAIIDLENLNEIHIDEINNKVIVGGGVRNREIYEAINGLGYPFPGGGCPTVGVSGFTLGGGWGYSARLLGLGCDNLLSIEMVNNEGKVIVANNEENSDLFWACRGAGAGNFGIITSLTFRVSEKIDKATLINMDFNKISETEMMKLVEEYQKQFKTLDKRANFKLAMYNSKTKGIGVKIVGLFYGNKNDASIIIQPFLDITSKKISCELIYSSVLDVNRIIQDSHPDYEMYKSGGRFLYNDLEKATIKNLINIIKNKPKTSDYAAITLYGLGGEIKEISEQETAISYRKAKFIVGLQSVWLDNCYLNENSKWVIKQYEEVENITKGAFINFPISCVKNHKKEYHGINLEKLLDIKNKYDKENFFEFEQGL